MDTESIFRLEREMTAPGREWLIRQGLFVKEEFSVPWGTCDLVGTSFSRERVQQRLTLGQHGPIGPRIRIAILNHIPDAQTGQSVTADNLSRDISDLLTANELQRELGHLIEGGFVQTTGSHYFQKLNGWVPLHHRIVALELKLGRVDEAFWQAQSHLSFATHSYVGLPSPLALRIATSKRRSQFLRAGIGIVAITKTGCEVLVSSQNRPSEPKDKVLQMHCVERFWRTRVRGN